MRNHYLVAFLFGTTLTGIITHRFMFKNINNYWNILLNNVDSLVQYLVVEDGENDYLRQFSGVVILLIEISLLYLGMLFLRQYKEKRSYDRIDELLQKSQEVLDQTNEYLDKIKTRQVPQPKYPFLEDEVNENGFLEIPVMHMAIFDNMSTARVQPESGDADSMNILDSAALSIASILDSDVESLSREASMDDVCYENKDFKKLPDNPVTVVAQD